MNLSVLCTSYKCFGDEPQGFDQIAKINVIIGRNNSGKSSLIELMRSALLKSPSLPTEGQRGNSKPTLIIGQELKEPELKIAFPESRSGSPIAGKNWWEFGKKLTGSKIFYVQERAIRTYKSLEGPDSLASKLVHQLGDQLVSKLNFPLYGWNFRRLGSERDILPEIDSDPSLAEDGSGCTNLIQNFFNKRHLDRSLVAHSLLREVNQILKPDIEFLDIIVQQDESSKKWEIYFEQAPAGWIALSQMGSGVKTILLMLCNLILIPALQGFNTQHCIFAFEELENNLHPSLQRRLFEYIHYFSMETGGIFLLTTHSSTAVDTFYKHESAQILHINNSGYSSTVQTTISKTGARAVIEDLGLRPSDLLYANCLIWLEGPSDRIYFNEWLRLFSNSQYQEGIHYQCIFYGGKILSHYAFEDQEESDQLIDTLNINQNFVLLMDSDKKNEEDTLNATKQRVIAQIQKSDGIAWVTSGREIENYIPQSCLEILAESSATFSEPLKSFEKIEDYLTTHSPKLKKILNASKTEFAKKIIPFLNRDELSLDPDFAEQMRRIIEFIEEANAIPHKIADGA